MRLTDGSITLQRLCVILIHEIISVEFNTDDHAANLPPHCDVAKHESHHHLCWLSDIARAMLLQSLQKEDKLGIYFHLASKLC